jgi:hypothetical protein
MKVKNVFLNTQSNRSCVIESKANLAVLQSKDQVPEADFYTETFRTVEFIAVWLQDVVNRMRKVAIRCYEQTRAAANLYRQPICILLSMIFDNEGGFVHPHPM